MLFSEKCLPIFVTCTESYKYIAPITLFHSEVLFSLFMVNFDIPLVLLNIKHIKISEFDAQFCVNIQCSSFSSLPSPQSSSWLHSSWLYIQRLFSHRKRNGDSQAISTESTEVNQSHFDTSGHWVTNYSLFISLFSWNICMFCVFQKVRRHSDKKYFLHILVIAC